MITNTFYAKNLAFPHKNKLLKTKLILTLLGIFGFSLAAYCQATITSVSPTRVTTGSVVTVTGTGFYAGIENTFRLQPGGYDITGAGNRVLENPTTVTFTVTQDDATPRDQELLFVANEGDSQSNEEGTGFNLIYVPPVKKIHNVSSSNRINPRVEEIYTDFSDVIDFKDNDDFNTGDNYSSTEFGKWEFYNITFPAIPHGTLVEAGGRGRGMFIGFTDTGAFVARGGDGRDEPGEALPAGTARIELPATQFAGKTGNLVVTMEPRAAGAGITNPGRLTLEWDEFGDGVSVLSQQYDAVAGYLGYDSFREWSGGNEGFVGNSDGNLAGSELTDPTKYDFNGTMGGMYFVNNLNSDVAWKSSLGTYTNDPSAPANPILPDNNQNLLGFKLNDTIYSTGANDALLEFYLNKQSGFDETKYVNQTFKAYSTNGVQNTTVSQHHIFTGDFLDGKYDEGPFEFLTNTDPNFSFDKVRGLSMFEVLYDGINGLNISTGINNINESTSIQFFSGNGEFGAVSDERPDLLIPNMAEAGGTDIYYFTDEFGNVIGTPLSIEISNSDTANPPLSHWVNDQYRVDLGVSFEVAKPSERIYGQDRQERPVRLIALELDDFGIKKPGQPGFGPFTSIQSIFNINAGAGGTADIPFLAYNGDTFKIKSPVVTERPVPRSICEADGVSASAVFTVEASVDGEEDNPSYVPTSQEELQYQWFKFNDPIPGETSKTLSINPISTSDLGLYRLKISNDFGATIVSVDIEEGGTRVLYANGKFNYPSGFKEAGTPGEAGDVGVADADRRLVITESLDIDPNEVIEGCSCEVFEGNEFTVKENGTLKLFAELNLRDADTIINSNTGLQEITPKAKFILENNASLVQIKNVTLNRNSGDILMKRTPVAGSLENSDYLYWSSPVEGFEIGNITGNKTYAWDATIDNNPFVNTFGNWFTVNDTEVMPAGKGYIKRWNGESAPSGEAFTEFTGVPNNGVYTVPLVLTPAGGTQTVEERNWNLIGNPYPSAINVKKFLEVNDGTIEGAVQLWTHQRNRSLINPTPFYQSGSGESYSPDDYVTANATGSTPSGLFNGNIASGQGFFVKALTAGEVEFNNTMRYEDEGGNNGNPNSFGTYGNDNFFRGAKTSKNKKAPSTQKLWLSIINQNNVASTTLIGYIEGATVGKDNLYDATANGTQFGIYSLIKDQKMVIQGRPAPFTDTDVLPVGVRIPQTGVYSIGIDKLEGSEFMENGQDIYIEDVYLNMVHDIRQSPYSFSAEPGEINDRFVLRYTNETLSTTENEFYETFIYLNESRLKIKSNKQINTIEIFDLTGKRVDRHFVMNHTEFDKEFNHSSGVYLASVLFTDGSVLNKKILN